MQEYQSYKGKYIGPGCYSSRAEIDEAIEREAVESVKLYAELFCIHKNATTAADLFQVEANLVDNFGYTWEDVNTIEAKTFKEYYKEDAQP